MTQRRLKISAALGALLISLAACGTQHSSDARQVDIGTAVSVTRATLDYGLNPAMCARPVDDLTTDVGTVGGWLAERCDWRLTGSACQEDELCAVQQIRDTGDFER